MAYGGSDWTADWPSSFQGVWESIVATAETQTLYVGNLPWAVTEADLMDAFAEFQAISARVATDRETGRSRGFGFVDVPKEMAAAAMEKLNGAEWGGRIMVVNEARPRGVMR
jgi:RNA recognition motif-containing protein